MCWRLLPLALLLTRYSLDITYLVVNFNGLKMDVDKDSTSSNPGPNNGSTNGSGAGSGAVPGSLHFKRKASSSEHASLFSCSPPLSRWLLVATVHLLGIPCLLAL